MSYHGYFAATALCHRMRSGNPASPRFWKATSWNAFDRLLVPIPSICTTMNPSSANACVGTAFVGEVNNKARLTEAIVLEIRARYVAGESCAAMSRDYGVRTSTVDRVIHGRTWKHLGLPPVPIHPICGEDNARSKLTAAVVTDIRPRYAAGGISQADLRREYGLSSGGIKIG